MDCEKPLISVIVPVYNVEKYLRRCLDSILVQTYSNIEILLIDDGSTDQSGKICDEFAKLDSRVRVFHKENGGVSTARNLGIEQAKGEYITFIDSDDYADEELISYLYGLIKYANAEISICCANTEILVCAADLYNEETIKFYAGTNDGKKEVLTVHESIKRLLYEQGFFVSPWAKLYKKLLFLGIKYPEGKLYEDTAATYKLILKAERVAYGRSCKYTYCVRNNSITRSTFSPRQLDLVEAADSAASDIIQKFPDLAQAGMRFRLWARFSTLNRMFNVGSEFYLARKEIIQFIKEHGDSILDDLNVPRKDKLGVYCLKLGYPIYKMAWRLYVLIMK